MVATARLRSFEGGRVIASAAFFQASGLELVDEPLGFLDELEFEDDHPTVARKFALRKAEWREDGRIVVEAAGGMSDLTGRLTWGEEGDRVSVADSGVTEEALNQRDPLPLIVWLVDEDGPRSQTALSLTIRGPCAKR